MASKKPAVEVMADMVRDTVPEWTEEQVQAFAKWSVETWEELNSGQEEA